jgi:glycosyltransferase involved in cell wall biosynthesis
MGTVPVKEPARIVAVIPAFNEERFIGSVVLVARQYADQVIVVDDGSSDRTAELATAAGARVVRQGVQGGKGRALNAGFRLARRLSPTAVVVLDGDAQHDPAEIPSLVAPILAGQADVVIGSRFLEVRSAIPWWRQVGQHALTAATNAASGVRLTDSQTGYRAFSPAALDHLFFHSGGLSVESEMQFQLGQGTLRITEVPVHVQYLDGSKRNPVMHGLKVIDTIVGLVARKRPLLLIGAPGLMLATVGLYIGLLTLETSTHAHVVPIGSAVLATLLLLGGLVSAATATILHAVEHLSSRLTTELGRWLGSWSDNVDG